MLVVALLLRAAVGRIILFLAAKIVRDALAMRAIILKVLARLHNANRVHLASTQLLMERLVAAFANRAVRARFHQILGQPLVLRAPR